MTLLFFFINPFIYLFIFGVHWVFVTAHGLSLVVASGGHYSLWCTGFSLRWLLLLWSTGSRHTGFSSCVTRAQQLCLTGSVTLRHVGSSQTRARTLIPCTGRWILSHYTTREVPDDVYSGHHSGYSHTETFIYILYPISSCCSSSKQTNKQFINIMSLPTHFSF